MPKRKTTEEFVEEVKKINEGYTVIGEYINNKTKITFKHEVCGCIFSTIPKDFLNGKSRCKKCGLEKLANSKAKSKEQFKREFEEKSKNEYTLLSDYYRNNKKVKVIHNTCGKEFYVTPNAFLSNSSGCPDCYGNKRKTLEEFKNEIYDKVGDEFEVTGAYKNNKTKIKLFHKKCGLEFEVMPHKFLKASSCPFCRESIGEILVRKFLEKKNLNFKQQFRFEDCRGEKYPLPFDFAVFDNSDEIYFLIEFDGEQHYKPTCFNGIDKERANRLHKNTRRNDKIKNNYCTIKNIPLLRISYLDKENIDYIIENFIDMLIPSQVN